MNHLIGELEELKIFGAITDNEFWENCIESVQRGYVPQELIGEERPCEEKDFSQYRMMVNKYLLNVLILLRHLEKMYKEKGARIDCHNTIVKQFVIHILVMVGEQNEKSLWNNAESVIIVKDIMRMLCGLFECDSISHMLMGPDDKFSDALMMLRPKLLKATWKTYPATVSCYKWLLHQIQKPELARHIVNVLPTALIIFDDFVPENRLIGLECIHEILQHCYLNEPKGSIAITRVQKTFFVRVADELLIKKIQLMENGYADVIYDALERLAHEREVRYIMPLYACFAILLATMEFYNNSIHNFEWTKRDDVIGTILDNMECEANLELRHAYMLSLPQLLTNIGCAKWCERLTRVLTEYCGNHTDLRTLKATLQASKTVLSMFPLRIPAHSTTFYTAFLKLHFDLAETPVFDKEITQSLESCIYLLYKQTPTVGAAIMRDDRMRSVIKNSVHLACLGDTKYCN